ncbi:hypothetical protein CBR_g34844 [Chara braunii]|uniref:Uncharacterized protein n=1 Tax=Chara braunii TaxID=69332 RepID=A0A388LJH4_CHABU|nr:hypothetical protein CBR_g34844 [Chara braunii]|eukprot:GBG82468.1 hypothetical protein CBR_g34844 [Chara braunii]
MQRYRKAVQSRFPAPVLKHVHIQAFNPRLVACGTMAQTLTLTMSPTGGDAVPARSSPIAGSPQGTPDPRESVDRSPCAARGLLGVSLHSGGPEVRLGKRRRRIVSHATGSVVGPGVTPVLPFAGVLGASPPGVAGVRDAASYGGVYAGPLLPSPLLPRRLDYVSTILLAPVWSHAVAPPCPAGGGSLPWDCSDAWRCPTVSGPRVIGAVAGWSAVPPQAPFIAPDSTPPVDDVDSSAAVGDTPCSGGNNIVRVCVRDACRRRLYALRNTMAGVGDNRGPVSDVIDRLLHWSLPAIRAEFGVEKEAKKVSNPHECVSEAQFMQFTKKRLKEALEQRFGPDVLTPAEERMKKSDFVAVVMRKMYPYGSRSNARALETDPDGLTEYHSHEVGMWFLRACHQCREEGGDADSLHHDIMLVADHWAGDHSGCVGGREVLCEKAGGRARLPLYRCTDTVYELVQRVLNKQCSTNITPYYVEFRHTSAVETFQGTIIIYVKKSVHFEKCYCARLSIAVIRWSSHYWRDPVRYVARIAASTSIRARPGFRRHYGHEAIDCWEDRLAASVFGSAHVSDWARVFLR